MAMGSYGDDDESDLMSEINMTPLVDVMLVLLIIFLVTLPVINQAVKVSLPQANSQPEDTRSSKVDLTVRDDGTVLWNGTPVDHAALLARLAAAGQARPVPQLHLFIDRGVPYERVARIMSEAQNSGVTQLGFVTQPQPR
ncbi:MAG: biopolymer transporter ExbD [Burkholderiales bacterium]|nr:biopolymer transporter ExbD [Burkholderiales bacterium]MDE2287172.1 biopolymer transporter ExbD [Burkholderiales bacterium]MDE2610527.1 biopolymer transporter ExbD [Burkholderiales bacterium]